MILHLVICLSRPSLSKKVVIWIGFIHHIPILLSRATFFLIHLDRVIDLPSADV
jgi:hypothetical protein